MDDTGDKALQKPFVPIQFRILLNLEEAAAYAGVGVNKLRELSHDSDFERRAICQVGARRMFVRQAMDEFFCENPGWVV